jgi:hypothetical protein
MPSVFHLAVSRYCRYQNPVTREQSTTSNKPTYAFKLLVTTPVSVLETRFWIISGWPTIWELSEKHQTLRRSRLTSNC